MYTSTKISDFFKPKRQKVSENIENHNLDLESTTSAVVGKEDAINKEDDPSPTSSSLDENVSRLVDMDMDKSSLESNDDCNDDEKPDCWCSEQCIEYKAKNPWLIIKKS